MSNQVFKVQGMSCGHCVKTIENNVGGLAGVQEVKVDLANAEVTVAFDDKILTAVDIAAKIEDQGFDVL